MATATNVKKSPAFKSLIAAGFNEEQALAAIATVVVAEANSDAPADTSKVEAPKPQTSQEKGEALVEAQGLKPTRGRIYFDGALIEAQTRVLKTGKPEVVKSAGDGHTTHLLVFKTERGTGAVQNLASA